MHFLFYFPSHFLFLHFLPAALPSLATCPGLSPTQSCPRSRSRPGVLCSNEVPLLSLPTGSIQEAAGTVARGSQSSPAGWEELRAAEQPLKHDPDPTPSAVYEAGTQVRPGWQAGAKTKLQQVTAWRLLLCCCVLAQVGVDRWQLPDPLHLSVRRTRVHRVTPSDVPA